MDGYPFAVPIQVRWRDLDAFAHVNNAVFATWIEIARAELWRERFGGRDALDIPFVVVRLGIDFRRPVGLYDEVAVGIRVGELRGSSFRFEYRIEAAGATAATAHTVQACVDGTTRKAVRIPADVRSGLEALRVDPGE